MPNGYVIYDGPSMIDGERIVAIVVGLAGSKNVKTGEMVQTYIIRPDMAPIEAVRSGNDASICGGCKHRGDGMGGARSCYVTLIHGPHNVFKGYVRGIYPNASPDTMGQILAGRMIRLGTYGDPAAVPLPVWQALLLLAAGWTGYSHQWQTLTEGWQKLLMASVDSVEQMDDAHERGWRTFRVGSEPVLGVEINCPASEEAGKKTQCIDCLLCMGGTSRSPRSIQIAPHGTGAKYAMEIAA
jgi:hypothetical protein